MPPPPPPSWSWIGIGNQAWVSNYIKLKQWTASALPCYQFNNVLAKVFEVKTWMINYAL